MTASDSSSSAASRTEAPAVDLLAAGLLPPLPAAFVSGDDLDLLEPLRFLPPAEVPSGEPPATDRSELAAGLAVANAAYGHPAAEELARRLADTGTRVVVAGQQPGLLGGPLYTLSKAVAAVLWARRLSAEGTPAVAIFWVATEDHDFREVSRVGAPTSDGFFERDLGEDPAPLLPVGMRTLGAGVTEILDGLREAVPGDRFASWVGELGRWYKPEARFGEAFCRLLVGILGEDCPLLLDSMLPAVKQAQRPWLRRVVACRDELEAGYRDKDGQIEARGYDLQVHPQPGASPLFFLHGNERRRIEWASPDRLRLRGVEGFEQDVAWLEQAIDENPVAVSPGVLARPAIQDAILGTYLQIMGPGEVSYLPQVAPLYRCLGLQAPWVALRPQALVLPSHQLDKLNGLPLDLADLVSPSLDLDGVLAGGKGADLVAPARREIEELLDGLKSSTDALDLGLAGAWKKTRQQIDRALETFKSRVDAAAARQDAISRQRAENLAVTVRPRGKLQERLVTTAYFPGKYGPGLAEALLEQLGLDPRQLHVITPN